MASDQKSVPLILMRSVLAKAICENRTDSCYSGACEQCPGTDSLQELLETTFDLYSVENVSFKQWTKTDRFQLEQKSYPKIKFIHEFLEKIPLVLEHDFLAKQQAHFLKQKKEALTDEECVVIGDFSENYSPVWQDSIQGVHWSDEQVTIHPFVVYYKQDGKLLNGNFVVISDSKDHKNESIFAFQCKLVPYQKQQIQNENKFSILVMGQSPNIKTGKMFRM